MTASQGDTVLYTDHDEKIHNAEVLSVTDIDGVPHATLKYDLNGTPAEVVSVPLSKDGTKHTWKPTDEQTQPTAPESVIEPPSQAESVQQGFVPTEPQSEQPVAENAQTTSETPSEEPQQQ